MQPHGAKMKSIGSNGPGLPWVYQQPASPNMSGDSMRAWHYKLGRASRAILGMSKLQCVTYRMTDPCAQMLASGAEIPADTQYQAEFNCPNG